MPSSIRATDQLSEILKDYDVTIVAFLREPLAHLISYWAELVCKKKVVILADLNPIGEELRERGREKNTHQYQ